MEILFLGTGSCTPTPKRDDVPQRFSTGFLVEEGGQSLMFDIGSGALQKMLNAGIDILLKPTSLFITHYHPDHTADVIPFMQGRAVAKRNGFDIKKLIISGPPNTNNFFNQILHDIERWQSSFGQGVSDDIFEFKDISDGTVVEQSGWKILGGSVDHFDSIAYRLEIADKVLVYSGDMGYDENLSKLGKDADIAVMECSYPDKDSLKGKHLCPEEIGQLARLGNFKHIVLTHLYPECEGREEEMVNKIHEFTDSEVTIAYDLLKINL